MQSSSMLPSRDGLEPIAARISEQGLRPDVLLFDLCGVLFDDTIWSRWLFQLVSRIGRRLCYDDFVRGWEDQFVEDVNSGRRDYWEAVQEYLLSLGFSRAAANEICVAAKARRKQFDESIRPLPGTTTGLANLAARGQRMAVIGNVPYDGEIVRQRTGRLGLNEFFADVLSSFDAGKAVAPQARYGWFAERLGVAPAAISFISGSANELRSAAAAGLATIAWQLPEQQRSANSITHLQELLPVVTSGRNHSLAS